MAEFQNIYKNHGAVKFLVGKKKLLLLSFNDFLYKRINGNYPKTTWKCIKGCSSTVKTNNGIFQSATPLFHHMHPPQLDEIVVIETNMKIKTRVQSEFNLTPRQIHTRKDQLLLKEEVGAHLSIDSYNKCRRDLYRYRQSTFPKAPQRREDIQIPDEWKLTLDRSETFLLKDDGLEERIMIFGTSSNLNILCKADHVISDGTFSVQPDIFSQLYVFHASYLGKVLPLLLCLLPSKTYNVYCRLLRLIENAATEIGLSFRPKKFHIDYELSMIKAVTEIFSTDSIQGCLFHYSQSIWRKVQELGFSVAYKNNKHVCRWVRRFCALPFLPLCDIDEGFILVHENAPDTANGTISREQIDKFHDYVLNTWVHDSDALFDRKLWNQFENNGPRTTNNAEGWNHKLNMQAKSRLSFFQFVHFLQNLQVDLDVTKFDLISQSPSTLSAKCRNTNDVLATAKQNYTTGNVDIISYLDSVGIALKLD